MATLLGGGVFCVGSGGLATMAVAVNLCWGGGGGCDGSELEVMRGVV
ncbi:hypothetical protein A2U01_0064083, partial [Trifolium medium]|nr:hypothetical protein [Trifolium medium]